MSKLFISMGSLCPCPRLSDVSAAHMALDMLVAIQDFNASTQYPLNIRIGMSTGAAVAGIIGKSKFLYDIWGDVVNTASRM